MFLLMLLKYSKKSADVSLKPPWAACKSLFITAHSDPLLPKETQQRQTGRSRDNWSLLEVYYKCLAVSRDKLYGKGNFSFRPLFPIVTKASVGVILQRNVFVFSRCVSSISLSVITSPLASSYSFLFQYTATGTRPDKLVHLQFAYVYGWAGTGEHVKALRPGHLHTHLEGLQWRQQRSGLCKVRSLCNILKLTHGPGKI